MTQRHILVVDDSAMMRQLMVMAVRKVVQDVSIAEAVNGREALARIKSQVFDLILTDMQMPEMDGGELIERVRKSLGEDLPIIVVTTRGEETDRAAGLAHGANGYLTKPLNPRALREMINRYVK